MTIESQYEAAVAAHKALCAASYEDDFDQWERLDRLSNECRILERKLPPTNNTGSITVFLS